MKKNIAIIVLSLLIVIFFVFGVTQQIATESERDAANGARAEAINYQQKAELQRKFAEQQSQRADSLQLLLDKCK